MNRHQLFAFLAAAAGQGAVMLGGTWGHLLSIVGTLGGILSNANSVSDVTGAIQKKLSAPERDDSSGSA